jgi:pimeloyl-ACP methyl ester carboxylesterase
MIEHLQLKANGATFHVARTGTGKPLLLLHGWPEFWLTWEPVMTRLATRHTLIAPDLRGFGDSDKPQGPYGPDQHAVDMLALMDTLGAKRFGVIGHDVGGAVMQPLARAAPERLAGLFFFDFVYPGIGGRMGTPDRLNHIWYQSFHQMEMAPALVGATRESCRTYVGHFLKGWSYRKSAFDDVLEAFIDNFFKPGNLAGGFAHYRAADRCAHLRALGRARSAVSLCVDRSLARDILESRSRDVFGRWTFPASGRPRSRSERDRGFLRKTGMMLKKCGTARRDTSWRSRAASLKSRSGSWGFAGRSERRGHASNCDGSGNAKTVLT